MKIILYNLIIDIIYKLEILSILKIFIFEKYLLFIVKNVFTK